MALRKVVSNEEVHCTSVGNIVSQWVEKITGYSSQYDDDRWSANQVIGPSNDQRTRGSQPRAWAMNVRDSKQFLEVQFKDLVYVTGVDIYGTMHSGGKKAIKALDSEAKWCTLWNTDRKFVEDDSRVFSPKISESRCLTRNIRVEIDVEDSDTRVDIDAIQLHGFPHKTEPETVASDLGQIVNDSKFSDCQFLLEGKHTVYAHKAIICARSDYFKAMFTEECQNKTTIEIDKVSYNSFQAVMHFLYSNNLPSTPPYDDTVSLTEVWRVADKFCMEGLKTLTTHLIAIMLDNNNVVDTYVAVNDTLPAIETKGNSRKVLEWGTYAGEIKLLRIEVDCTGCGSWVEIDAIQLRGCSSQPSNDSDSGDSD